MVNTPIPHSLKSEAKKAAKILRDFTMPSSKTGPDKLIPAGIITSAKGLAVITVFKAGFLVTARGGSGIVFAKLEGSGWSAPSAIGLAGLGGGFELGVEVTDFVIILNTRAAVEAFSKRGNLTLGGNFTIAAGPLGRNIEGNVAVRSPAAIYTYSKTKGLFAGISIEGTALIERKDANRKFYGAHLSAQQILSGEVDPPVECCDLYNVMDNHERRTAEMALNFAKQQAIKHQDKIEQKASSEVSKRYGIPWISKTTKSKSSSKTSSQSSFSTPSRSQSAWALSEASHKSAWASSETSHTSGKSPSLSSSVRKSQAQELASELGAGIRPQQSHSHSFSDLHNDKASRRLSMPLAAAHHSHQQDFSDSDEDEVWVIADHSYTVQLACDLSFQAGDKLKVLTQTHTQDDWWEGIDKRGNHGIFPANYVHLVS